MRWSKYQSAFEYDSMFRQLPALTTIAPVTVGGFTRYKTEVADLPPVERKKVDAVADGIVASHRPGRYQVIGVLLIGHADQDLGKGAGFEHEMSIERAERVRNALLSAVESRSVAMLGRRVRAVAMRVVGAGATQRIYTYPRDEAQRAANRRVAIYLAEGLPESWTFWASGPGNPQPRPELVSLRSPSDQRVSSVRGGVPFFIDPDVFDFAPDPTVSNWQTTSCVLIRFGYGSPFLPRMQIDVGVMVGAPLELRDGRRLSVREAQLDSANAATSAATIIVAMLDEGAIGPSEIQPRFVGFMGGAIMATGLGYRVKGCHPKSPAK